MNYWKCGNKFKIKTMKNIHLLPTDKPSRVYNILGSSRIGLTSNDPFYTKNFGGGTQNLNIYITSDEEIKEGNWIGYPNLKNWVPVKYLGGDLIGSEKKIILTTDQDLIKAGVQAIDDEFLEWFVKNPTCEEVEIETKDNWYIHTGSGKYWEDEPVRMKRLLNLGDYEYKIIIPQEEPETSYVKSETKFLGIEFTLKDGFKQFIPKQETLEEAIKRLVELNRQDAFREGAKSQLERMYSEEDLRKAYFSGISSTGEGWNGEYANGNNPNIEEKFSEGFEKWFEQFKKK